MYLVTLAYLCNLNLERCFVYCGAEVETAAKGYIEVYYYIIDNKVIMCLEQGCNASTFFPFLRKGSKRQS
jgi:hypothetical protein